MMGKLGRRAGEWEEWWWEYGKRWPCRVAALTGVPNQAHTQTARERARALPQASSSRGGGTGAPRRAPNLLRRP